MNFENQRYIVNDDTIILLEKVEKSTRGIHCFFIPCQKEKETTITSFLKVYKNGKLHEYLLKKGNGKLPKLIICQ